MTTKAKKAESNALSLLGVGAKEQEDRMQSERPSKKAGTPPGTSQPALRTQVSVQFSHEGLALLRKAQARLLERGVPRANMKGVALETVLAEWLDSSEKSKRGHSGR